MTYLTRRTCFRIQQKRAIKKLVNKFGKCDVVCIGTRKVKNINCENGEPFYSYGARIDCLVGGKQGSYRMYDKDFFSELDYYLNPICANPKLKEKTFYKRCFDWVKEELHDLEDFKNEKSSTKPSFFANTAHDLKIDVRQWRRRKKSYNNDSIWEKIRNFVYTAKDFNTDIWEQTFGIM